MMMIRRTMSAGGGGWSAWARDQSRPRASLSASSASCDTTTRSQSRSRWESRRNVGLTGTSHSFSLSLSLSLFLSLSFSPDIPRSQCWTRMRGRPNYEPGRVWTARSRIRTTFRLRPFPAPELTQKGKSRNSFLLQVIEPRESKPWSFNLSQNIQCGKLPQIII